MQRLFQRLLSGLISVALVLNPIALDARLYALVGRVVAPGVIFPMIFAEAQAQAIDPFMNAAALGQAAGGGQLSAPPLSGFDPNTQTFSIPSGSGVAQAITQEQLFKGAADVNAQADFSNAVAAANGNGDHAAMLSLTDSLTNQTTGRLNTQPNSQGNAFQALNGSILSRSHPDMSNDPMLTVTKDVYSNTANLQNMLGNCDQSTTTVASTTTAHLPDIQRCDRIIQPTSCNVERIVTNVIDTTSCTVGDPVPNYMPNLIVGAPGETLCDPHRVDNKQAFLVSGHQIWTDVSAVNPVPAFAGTFPQWSSFTYRCNCAWTGGYCDTCTGYNSVEVWSTFLGCTGNICNSTLYLIENLPAPLTWDNTYPSCPAGSVSGGTLAQGGWGYDANGNWGFWLSGYAPANGCYTSTNNGTTSVGYYVIAASPSAAIPYYLVSTQLPNGVSGYTYLSQTGGWDPNNGNYPANVSVPLASIPSVTIRYDKPRVVRIVTDMIVETPPGCSNDSFCQATADATWVSTGSVLDQASTSQWNCTDASNSRIFQGVDVTPGTATGLSQIYPGVPPVPPAPICYRADARNYSCNFNTGQMACFIDSNGVQQCPQNVGGVQSTCDVLEQPTADRPACSFISSACTLPDPVTGTCHNFTDTYDCGNTVTVPGASTSSQTYVCPGQIRCVGTECVNPPTDAGNKDFTKVAALQSATAFMSTDSKCSTQGMCEIFTGEAYDCKKAVGAIQNCCVKPAGVSIVQMMEAAYLTWNAVKATETVAALQAQGAAVASSIGSFANTVAPDLTKALTTAYESIVGPSAASAGGGAAAASLTAPLYQAMGTMLNNMVPGLGNSIFATAPSSPGTFTGGLSQAPGSLGSFIGPAMTAYMIVMVTIMVIQLLWECTKREFELGAKRELKSCHYVGTYCAEKIMALGKQVGCLVNKESYCCFTSPLPRIIQEQGRPQLPLGWGPPEAPDCRGLTMQEMSALNFDLMDLSEWVAILAISGKIPQNAAAADAKLTDSKLTSAQTPLAGATSPVDTRTTINNNLTAKPTSGEAARAQGRAKMGF